MAGNASDYLEEAIGDHVFMNVPYTSPSTLYLAVYSVAPTDAGGGTEATGGSYAREVVTFEQGASPGQYLNDVAIDFVNMPAGTWVAYGIHDHPTAGNLLTHAAPVSPKTTSAGQTLNVAAGDVAATVT